MKTKLIATSESGATLHSAGKDEKTGLALVVLQARGKSKTILLGTWLAMTNGGQGWKFE